MTIPHVCEGCQTPFVGRSSARFCSERCRKRAARRGTAALPTAASPDMISDSSGPVTAATLRELAAAGKDQTSRGLATLALARRLDSGLDSGAAVAALVREHGESMARALSEPGARDIVDELRDELAARRAGLTEGAP